MPNINNMDTLAKILAQAENTDNEAEAEAFMAQAERRAAVMGVTLDMARAHSQSKEFQTPVERQFEVGSWNGRYNAYMVKLFLAIAHPHDVRVSISGRNVYCFGTGFPSDLDIVGALFEVAAHRMVADANAALKRGEQKKAYNGVGVDGRVWRAHFYDGYISTLAARLWSERAKAIKEWEMTKQEGQSPYMNEMEGSQSTALVMSNKKDKVEEAYRAANPHFFHEDGSSRTKGWQAPEREDYVGSARRAGSSSAQETNLGDTKRKVGA